MKPSNLGITMIVLTRLEITDIQDYNALFLIVVVVLLVAAESLANVDLVVLPSPFLL